MKVSVLITHGIGVQDESFADTFLEDLKGQLGDYYPDIQLVVEKAWWQSDTQPFQDELGKKFKSFGFGLLRRFLISYAGDALSYQPRGDRNVYGAIHKTVDSALCKLADRNPDGPLVIISHSLGTIVMSNYMWDAQHKHSLGTINFKPTKKAKDYLKKLSAFYTMGSPLYLWSSNWEDGGDPVGLPEDCSWYNIHSFSDVISAPLKKINSTYMNNNQIQDLHFTVGGPLNFWNPSSHNKYWKSKGVIAHIAKTINKSTSSE